MKRFTCILLVGLMLFTSASAGVVDLSAVQLDALSKAELTILKTTLRVAIAKAREGNQASGSFPKLGIQFSDYSLGDLEAFLSRLTGEPIQVNTTQGESEHDSLIRSIKSSAEKHFDTKQPVEVALHGKNLIIEASGKSNLTTKLIKAGMLMAIYEVMSENRNAPVDFDFLLSFPLVDKLGNRQLAIVMKVTYKSETMAKINWDRFLHIDVQDAADRYWEHPAFSK